MQLPALLEGESLKRLIQGAIVGAIATAFIGFNWGGWTTQSSAKQMALADTSTALVAVLGPMCADKFRAASDVVVNMAEFKKVSSWQQEFLHPKGRLGDISRHGLAESGGGAGVRQVTDDVASLSVHRHLASSNSLPHSVWRSVGAFPKERL